MSILKFKNKDTGIAFLVCLVRKGETNGGGARHNRDEPLVEFYDNTRGADLREPGTRIACYYASQMLRAHPEGMHLYEDDPEWKVSAENCKHLARWLRAELKKPWIPPPPPPRPIPDAPTEGIAAIERKVTIYLGGNRHEATWFEVYRGRVAQYRDAYRVRFIPKRARLARMFEDCSNPKTVILDGWGHPEFVRTGTMTIGVEVKVGDRDKTDFERYVESLPLSAILLDKRGLIIDEGY